MSAKAIISNCINNTNLYTDNVLYAENPRISNGVETVRVRDSSTREVLFY